jgi:hypothetical protein
MKNFLAVYLGSGSSPEKSKWDSLSPEARKEREAAGMKAWSDWMAKHQAIIVTNGGPLGKTKRVSSKGTANVTNEMTGFVVVKAESHDVAAALFTNHPHFAIFPGVAVEVMEVLPIPGM